ncbi:DUF6968 family protein [Saccharophagus degradans]|uniref:DUF6968 family protein n=1 Tax=Saccharophagus degradans TaxID=86304 RepID=UPI0026E46CC4|nr:hypothetical protein [Saccharophagus degradans]
MEIAQTEIFTVTPDGRDKILVLKIGAPQKRNEDEWMCYWEISGLHENVHATVSNDKWHSLMLVIRTIEQLLTYYVEDGGRLYWEKSGEEIAVSDLIPRWAS